MQREALGRQIGIEASSPCRLPPRLPRIRVAHNRIGGVVARGVRRAHELQSILRERDVPPLLPRLLVEHAHGVVGARDQQLAGLASVGRLIGGHARLIRTVGARRVLPINHLAAKRVERVHLDGFGPL